MQQKNDSDSERDPIRRNDPVVDYDSLYQKSRAQDLGLGKADFILALQKVTAKRLGDKPPQEITAFLERLHLEDLALTCACARGLEDAWREFTTRFPRNLLFRMAKSFVAEETLASEAADGLYADLFGVDRKARQHASKLEYYSGEGSLKGWISQVLRQNCLHLLRPLSDLSIDALAETGLEIADKPQSTEDFPTQDPRITEVVHRLLADASAEDRFILSCYYLDRRTLKEIGAILGVDGSTISRRLGYVKKTMRQRLRSGLFAAGLSRRQVDEVFDMNMDIDISKHFAQGKHPEPF